MAGSWHLQAQLIDTAYTCSDSRILSRFLLIPCRVGALRVQYLRMVQIEQHHEGVEDLSDKMRLEEFCRQGPPTGAVMPSQRCGWRRPQGVCSVQYSLKERAASPSRCI